MYLIWIFGSTLIRSNNQSSATLWVLETRLIVGLLPLMIILITASLSSNTYNKASWCEDWTFEKIESTLLKNVEHSSRLLFNGLHRSIMVLSRVSKNKNNRIPINQEQESRLISIQRPKRWFRILLNCVKLKFVSYTSNLLEQMYDFQKRTESSRSGFRVLKISCKIGVLKRSQSALICSVTHIAILFVFTGVMNYEISRFRRLPQALVHFVIDRASLFTDQRISGLPIRAKYKHFRTFWEHTYDNSPTDFISSSLKWWSSMHGVDTL